jgi:hypothetical protein
MSDKPKNKADSGVQDFDDIVAALAMQGANPLAGLTPVQVASAIARWYVAYGRRPTLVVSEH